MTKATLKQNGYDYELTIAGRDSQLWFHIGISDGDGIVWAGSLKDLVDGVLLGEVAKQQLQEDAVAIKNNVKNNASLIATLSKTHPGKIKEFTALITGEEGQVGQDTK